MDPRVATLRRLAALTERQLDAARSLQTERLSALNLARTDLLFQLRTELDNGGPLAASDRDALLVERRRLETLERRLSLVCTSVLQALSFGPRSENPTYSRLRYARMTP